MRRIALPTLAALALLGAGATATQAASSPAARACTPAEIAQGPLPAFVTARADDYSSQSPALRSLTARRPYAIVVDPFRFESDKTASYVESGSVELTPPPGVALSPLRRTSDASAATFTAPAQAGALAFGLTYTINLLDTDDRCTADTTLSVPVDAGRAFEGTATIRTPADDNTRFFLHLAPQRPIDPRPLTIALRFAEGTTRAPGRGATPLRSYTVRPLGRGLDKGGYVNGKRIVFAVRRGSYGAFDVEVSPSIFRGTSIRFGFSVDVTQAGRTIAGMRSGAICTDRLFHRSDGATRHRATCRHPGFAARP